MDPKIHIDHNDNNDNKDFKEGPLIVRKSNHTNNDKNKDITKVNKLKLSYTNIINKNKQDYNLQILKNEIISKKILYNNHDEFDKTIIIETDSDIISLDKDSLYLEFKSKINKTKKRILK